MSEKRLIAQSLEQRHNYKWGMGEAQCIKCGKHLHGCGAIGAALTDKELCQGWNGPTLRREELDKKRQEQAGIEACQRK